MSSKKQLRRKRREQRAATRSRRINPAQALILVVVGLVIMIGVVALIVGQRAQPPRPGMVWSPEHGHWH
jgi:CHASE3 domain sensor protein